MKPIEWTLIGALVFAILFVAWAAWTLGDDPKPRRPLPFPKGERPYTGLHSEDGRTRRLSWPPASDQETAGLAHWVLPNEPRAEGYYQPAPTTPNEPAAPEAPSRAWRTGAPINPSPGYGYVIEPGEDRVVIHWDEHQPPAGWNEDAR